MAGTGSTYGVDKGFLVATDYSGGVVNKFRCVRFSATQAGKIDLNTAVATTSVGVVQEDVDAAKVATGKVVADVRMLGISRVLAGDNTAVLGARVQVAADGRVVVAATTNKVVGIVVGAPAVVANGDIVEVLLTPGAAGA